MFLFLKFVKFNHIFIILSPCVLKMYSIIIKSTSKIKSRIPYVYGFYHFISCSKEENSSVLKNSISEMSNPSHIFLIFTIPEFLLSPFKILLIVDSAIHTLKRLSLWILITVRHYFVQSNFPLYIMASNSFVAKIL